MDRTVIIASHEHFDLASWHESFPGAVTVNARPELPVPDGHAQLVVGATSDVAAAELLRPVAVGGMLAVCGPAEALADLSLPAAERATTHGISLPEPPQPGWEWLVLRRTGIQHTGSAGCIICGRENASGLRWQYWQSGDYAWASGVVPAQLQGFEGIVHGGIVAAMLDDALWYAINAATGEITLTAELTTRYRLPVTIGTQVTAAARYTGSRRRIHAAEARLWGPDGHVLATATGRFLPGGSAMPDLEGRIG